MTETNLFPNWERNHQHCSFLVARKLWSAAKNRIGSKSKKVIEVQSRTLASAEFNL
jgi:hypothetical protein